MLFSDKRLGITLEALSKIDQRKLATSISLRNLSRYDAPVSAAHIDTTNVSLFGEYDTKSDDDTISITYGKAKDKGNELKLAGIGSAVQEDSLPLFFEALSGNLK